MTSTLLLTLCLLTTPADTAVSAETKAQTIESLCQALHSSYVFPDKAEATANLLRTRLKDHAYDDADGPGFAKLINADMKSLCHDAHLHLSFSESALPVRKDNFVPSPTEIQRMTRMDRFTNGGIDGAQRLAGNVGLITLSFFPPADHAKRAIAAAMSFVADTDALIFDDRQNGGGDPATVRLLCSYLFDSKPVHLNDIYTRQNNHTEEFWTLKKVEGPRYLGREVYVLTGPRTGSGAEEFAYDLQNLKRSTTVGSSTWGGANPGDLVRLNDHFMAFVPFGRAVNPYTKTNWEGPGVQPDIKTSPDDALKTAHILALKHLIDKAIDEDEKKDLARALEQVQSKP